MPRPRTPTAPAPRRAGALRSPGSRRSSGVRRREGAGLTTGDVITAVGGAPVTSAEGLGDLIPRCRKGDAVTITWTDSSSAVHSVVVA